MAQVEAKIIQIRFEDDDSVRKRLLRDAEGLKRWIDELVEEFGVQFAKCLCDDDDVEVGFGEFDLLRTDAAYHLRSLKKRRTDAGGIEELKQLMESEDFEAAWTLFAATAKSFIGNAAEEPQNLICNPVKIRTTWEGEEGSDHVVKQLAQQCATVDRNIRGIEQIQGSNEEDSRAGRVVGIRLGSGCGKSHLLLETPRLLGKPGIYITYNLEQALLADHGNPREAILLRILLRLAEIPHSTSDQVLLNSLGSVLLNIGRPCLRKFVVHQLAEHACAAGVVVGVDEVMALAKSFPEKGTHLVRQVISELGEVATDYYKTKRGSCYVFVTSLNQRPFYSASGKGVVTWTPKPPNDNAAEMILEQYRKGRSKEQLKALLIASAGFHFRSMVFAAQAIGEFSTPSVQTVVSKVYDRWRHRVEDTTIQYIKELVLAECRGSTPIEVRDKVEDLLDATGAVPPALVLGAFGTMAKSTVGHHSVDVKSPLYNLFNCEFAFTDDAKQLEQFGESFDLFRASEKLPVLTGMIQVHVVTSSTKKSEKWFQALEYPRGLTRSPDSLFQTTGDRTKLSQTGTSPTKEKYYSPNKTNHPFVDRAFIARSVEGADCFILIQDKVNNDVPKAVEGLNKAGDLLKKEHPDTEILCILNVIGAGPNTTSQRSLKFSYVLVGEKDLDKFYSAHFAPVARFIRKRHELADQRRREQASSSVS